MKSGSSQSLCALPKGSSAETVLLTRLLERLGAMEHSVVCLERRVSRVNATLTVLEREFATPEETLAGQIYQ